MSHIELLITAAKAPELTTFIVSGEMCQEMLTSQTEPLNEHVIVFVGLLCVLNKYEKNSIAHYAQNHHINLDHKNPSFPKCWRRLIKRYKRVLAAYDLKAMFTEMKIRHRDIQNITRRELEVQGSWLNTNQPLYESVSNFIVTMENHEIRSQPKLFVTLHEKLVVTSDAPQYWTDYLNDYHKARQFIHDNDLLCVSNFHF